jgi:signal transduction histidine kinase
MISVEDDGPGLPEPVRAKLFSPFVTTKAAGSGLGLPISKKIAEALGGTLNLRAVSPHGTRAELCFHGTNSGH